MTEPAPEEIARQIFDRGSESFAARSLEGMASLYSDRALFLGSNPVLLRGKAGVRQYFSGNFAALEGRIDVRFTDIVAERLAPDVIDVAAVMTSHVRPEPVALRITLSLVRESEGWAIASHHVSRPNLFS